MIENRTQTDQLNATLNEIGWKIQFIKNHISIYMYKKSIYLCIYLSIYMIN